MQWLKLMAAFGISVGVGIASAFAGWGVLQLFRVL